jgi:hypothetical protein
MSRVAQHAASDYDVGGRRCVVLQEDAELAR